MHPIHDPNTIISDLPESDVIGVCDYCHTPDVARVLVTDCSGFNPRMACADPASCAGTQPVHPLTTGSDDGYRVTESGLWALAVPVQDCHADVHGGEAPGTAPQVLRGAARYLERHGWIQGAYYDPSATVFTPAADIAGAIGMVCYGGPVEAPAQHFSDPGYLDFEEAVLHLDRYLLAEDGSESYEFNDARGRQIDDVIRVLRDAASRPAEELIDAIRAIEALNADMARLVELLVPHGIWAEQAQPESSGAVTADDAEHAVQGGDVR